MKENIIPTAWKEAETACGNPKNISGGSDDMKSLTDNGNRREFLQHSGTMGFGLASTTLVSLASGIVAWAEPQDQLPGFDPGKADRDKSEKWTQLAVGSVNSILAGTAKFSDFDYLASAYRDYLRYLHELGFDKAGEQYIAKHKNVPAPSEHSVSRWFEHVAALGLKINREQWNDFIVTKSRNPKYVDGVLALLRKDQAVQFHEDVADAIRSGGKETQVLHARTGRIVLSGYHEQVLETKFSERTCTYLDWGGAYLGVVALPIGITPVGAALGVFVVGLWAIAKIGGC
jgi:hypothetical protein